MGAYETLLEKILQVDCAVLFNQEGHVNGDALA